MFQSETEARPCLCAHAGHGSAGGAMGYFLPEGAFHQLEVARDLAGFIQDLAGEVGRSQMAVNPVRLASMLEVLVGKLSAAIAEGQFGASSQLASIARSQPADPAR